MMKNQQYKPVSSWTFPPEFIPGIHPTGMVIGEKNIRQSLEILFSTIPGQRIHRADYGFSFKEMTFEPANLTARELIKKNIEQTVLLYEPRVRVNAVLIDDTHTTEGKWLIQLDYTIIETDTKDQFLYSFVF